LLVDPQHLPDHAVAVLVDLLDRPHRGRAIDLRSPALAAQLLDEQTREPGDPEPVRTDERCGIDVALGEATGVFGGGRGRIDTRGVDLVPQRVHDGGNVLGDACLEHAGDALIVAQRWKSRVR